MLIRFVHSELQTLGIEYLSAVLKKQGYQTDLVVDPYFPFLKNFGNSLRNSRNYKKNLLKRILLDKPDIIAFSVASYNFEWFCQISLKLREQSSAVIVAGGIQATLLPEIVFQKAGVDFIIRGEADIAFLELVESLGKGNDFSKIKNLCYKTKGIFVKNSLRELIENLDELPYPDKDILPVWLNKKLYRIITSRGCIGECSYCCAPIVNNIYQRTEQRVRRRSVKNVIDELKLAKLKYGIKKVLFEDDLFTFNQTWVDEFAKKYVQEINLPCLIHATPGTLNSHMVKILKQMNCCCVELGVQSLNQKIRKNILKRYYSNEKIRQIVTELKKNKINCICDNIVGLPQEKLEDIVQMIRFYANLKPGKVEVLCLEFYPEASIVKKSNLSEEDIEKIGQGQLIVSRGDNPIMTSKMMLLLGLNYILPEKIINFLLKRKIYKIFPYLRNFNHVNEAIYYFSALFKKNRQKNFISYRADVFFKIRYLIEKKFWIG